MIFRFLDLRTHFYLLSFKLCGLEWLLIEFFIRVHMRYKYGILSNLFSHVLNFIVKLLGHHHLLHDYSLDVFLSQHRHFFLHLVERSFFLAWWWVATFLSFGRNWGFRPKNILLCDQTLFIFFYCFILFYDFSIDFVHDIDGLGIRIIRAIRVNLIDLNFILRLSTVFALFIIFMFWHWIHIFPIFRVVFHNLLLTR